MVVPTAEMVPPSPPPKAAKNKMYQELAMKAERVVPKVWWRDGFASDLLLLSHNDTELPRKQFDASSLSNKKLKNLYQCVTRQQFIRKTLDLSAQKDNLISSSSQERCTSMDKAVVQNFFSLWSAEAELLGGKISTDVNGRKTWTPTRLENGKLLLSALEVLELFFAVAGGIWTGCFKLERSQYCRGALAGYSKLKENY